jgi:small GTP-binding protein
MEVLRRSLSARFSTLKRGSIKSSSMSTLPNPENLALMDFKIAVVGAENTGKSQIISQYIQNTFDTNYNPTIEDCYSKCGKFDIQKVMPHEELDKNEIIGKLDILDTAGSIAIDFLGDTLGKCDGYIIVYAHGDDSSYDAITTYFEKILTAREGKDAPVIIVGNMSEKTREGKPCEVAEQLGCPYISVSAAKRINIDECFQTLVCEIINQTFVAQFAGSSLISAAESSRLSRRKTVAVEVTRKHKLSWRKTTTKHL